jgi:hypothetical protein
MNENDNVVNTWVSDRWRKDIDPITGKEFEYKSNLHKKDWQVISRLKYWAKKLENLKEAHNFIRDEEKKNPNGLPF